MRNFYTYSTYSKKNNKKNHFTLSKIFVLACITLILSSCGLLDVKPDAKSDAVSLVAVSATSNYAFVITDTGALYAWGYNKYGQLGLGDKNNRNTPTKVGVAGVHGWHSVSTGVNNTLAITNTGELYAWGKNRYGQLGLGDKNNRNTPTKVNVAGVHGWLSVSTKHNPDRTFGITDTGELYTWGGNRYGALGLGDKNNRNTPTKVNVDGVSRWHSVSAGSSGQTFAITDTGALYAWGENKFGELGLGDKNNRNTPTQVNVAGVHGWLSVSAGKFRTFAITNTGALYAWGQNFYGELGLGDKNDRNTPTKVNVDGVNRWHSISAGFSFHVLAITDTGALYAWGQQKTSGELGLGSSRFISKSSPQLVKNVSGWYSVQATSWHFSLAITTDGALYAWGQNFYGSLPVGDEENRNTPTLVPMSVFSD